jgi:hypothetical protein
MAQADNKKGFWPLKPDAKACWVPIVASQTLAAGDVVYNNGGSCQIALANTARIAGVVGRACASLATGTLVPVFGWDEPDMVFVGRQDDTSTLAAGSEVDLVGTTGVMQLDGNASTTDVFTCLYELDTDETDAAGKRWAVRINKHHHATID